MQEYRRVDSANIHDEKKQSKGPTMRTEKKAAQKRLCKRTKPCKYAPPL